MRKRRHARWRGAVARVKLGEPLLETFAVTPPSMSIVIGALVAGVENGGAHGAQHATGPAGGPTRPPVSGEPPDPEPGPRAVSVKSQAGY